MKKLSAIFPGFYVLLTKKTFYLTCVLALLVVHSAVNASVKSSGVGSKYDGTRHALLVSVSEYKSLKKRFQLIGPKNDAVLVRSILESRGFNPGNITVLADNVADASQPTYAAIIHAFDSLASSVKKGDFVYIHFAGHGSQQPSAVTQGDNVEADGMDEIFLPSDIGRWNGRMGTVENALLDDVVGEKLAAIRDRGAFVWVVFDSCHSGTMTRAINVEERDRRLPPAALGVSQQQLDVAASKAVKTRGKPVQEMPLDNVTKSGSDERGGLVAFYAAQTSETTPEMRLPRGDIDRRSHGLFTFTLMEVITQNPGITYRQASQELFNRYSALNRSSPTPLIEGTDLDAPIFGSEALPAVQQWKLLNNEGQFIVKAGSIHNVTKDSILSVLPGPTSSDKDIIGYVSVLDAGVISSTVAPVKYNDKPVLAPDDIPEGAYVRMDTPAITLLLTVALPPATSSEFKATLESIQKDKNAGIQLAWVAATDDADIRLYEHNKRIYILPPSAEFDESKPVKSKSLSLNDKKLQQKLMSNLIRVAKVTNLMRLSTQVGGSVVPLEEQVVLEMQVTRKATGKIELLDAGTLSTLLDGDKVALKVINNKSQSVDVTVLFVGNDYGIQAVYPRGGRSNRIEAGKSLSVANFMINTKTTGLERLVMIATTAEKTAATSNFSFLAQASLESSRGNSRSAESSLHGLFKQAGFGDANTRGISMEPESNLKNATMRVFSWTTAK